MKIKLIKSPARLALVAGAALVAGNANPALIVVSGNITTAPPPGRVVTRYSGVAA